MSAKILTVDSGTDIRHLIEVRLKKAGYQIVTAANGDDAAQLALMEQPDVVISGVRLPGLDGLTLTRRLKAQPNAPLVILLSILGGDHDIAAGFEAGADDYLTKPFSPLVLIDRVRVNLIRAGRAASLPLAEREAANE